MTVKEVEILVTANIEPAMKEIKKIMPQFKQQVAQAVDNAQKTMEEIDMKKVSNKVQKGIENILKYSTALAKLKNIYETLSNMATNWSGDQSAQIQQLIKDIEYVQYLLGSIFEPVTNLISNIGEAFSKAWQNNAGIEIIEHISNGFSNLSEVISAIVQTIEEWTKSENFQEYANAIISICNTISSIFEKITTKLKEIWYNGGAETFQNLLEATSKAVQAVDAIMKALQPVMEFGNAVIQPLIEGIIQGLSGVFKTLGHVLDFITGVFQGDWSKVWTNIGNIFSTVWNNMTILPQKILESIRNIISIILDSIKNKWNNVWNGLKMILTNILNGMKNIIKQISNAILGCIEGLANGIIKGINTVILALNRLRFHIPDWVPILGGKFLAFNISFLNPVTLPRLAKGGIIHSPTVALMGEYAGVKSNPEIVTPQNIMYDTMIRALSSVELNSNNDRPINLTVYVSNKKLGDILLDNLREKKRQTGQGIEALVN